MQDEINLVWQYLLPAFKKKKLPADAVAVSRLKERIKTLALPLPQKNNEAFAAMVNGKNFTASSNDLHLQNISFSFSNDFCRVKFQTGTAIYQIAFGAGKWQAGETNMPGPALTAGAIENTSMLSAVKIKAIYTCKDAKTLTLVLLYIKSQHTVTFTYN